MAYQFPFKDPSKDLPGQLIELANAQYDSDAYKRLFKTKFNKFSAQTYFLQHAHFNLNRRDCWGYVQGASPMRIKKLVWEHEEEELYGDRERGVADHYTLAVKQGEALGLTPDDFQDAEQMDGTFTCCQAWLNVAQKSHWLEAFAASSALEVSNSNDLIEGGCLSKRVGEKLRDDLGIPMRKQYSNAEHVTADVTHGLLLLDISRELDDDADRRRVLDGAKKSWKIDRTFRNFMASLVEKYA
jgi:pyrroloquinoline quinone (PQQ) biosynthesis protein C